MTQILRMTRLYAPMLKEDPADADITSVRLLTRAGMIRKTGSGLYTYLPLGWRVIKKIEAIVRHEMDETGAQEIMMPILQPSDLWRESGRWGTYGPEMMTVEDRHNRQLCLGPTHEEVITDLVRGELRSYKELPVTLYQIQSKYRDEIRPRFGLMRSREFIMKDGYSFDADKEGMARSYQDMYDAYGRICEECGLDWRPVQADTGEIGGNASVEFHALADSGEASLVSCTCGWAANAEIAACIAHPEEIPGHTSLEKVKTPDCETIEKLADFLGVKASQTVKALVMKDRNKKPFVIFVPGDHQLNDLKLSHIPEFEGSEFMSDQELLDAGLHKGFIGPVNLPKGIRVVADQSLKNITHWAVGANEPGYHFLGAELGKDFKVDFWGDFCVAQEGDSCPECGKPIKASRGIEVGQVFQLGDKYSRAMNAQYLDENGKKKFFQMGCYGVGISRMMAAVVEQYNDAYGMKWPVTIAPCHVCILPLQMKDEHVVAEANTLAQSLADIGVEVVIDDRSERPGVKFSEADLMGWPVQIVVSKRGVENKAFEVKNRMTDEKQDVTFESMRQMVDFSGRQSDSARVFLERVANVKLGKPDKAAYTASLAQN